MASYETVDYPVPFIKQDKEMSCWYASAQMVLAYRGVGNMVVQTSTNVRTLMRYFDNKGAHGSEFAAFAAEVGLSSRQASLLVPDQSGSGWASTLKRFGPLWTPILVNTGKTTYGHVVVVRGVRSGGGLWVHDPANILATERDIGGFSAAVCWALPMLFKLSRGSVF